MVQGQESFKKYYRIPNQIGGIKLQRDTISKFKDMTQHDRDSITGLYPLNSKIKYTISQKIEGKDAILKKVITVDSSFYAMQKVTKQINVEEDSLKGNVKFEKDKITVNAYLKGVKKDSVSRLPIMFYTLEDRQSIKLKFGEITVSTLAIPLKYRFGSDNVGRKSEYSTGFNGNLVLGYSFGNTRFFYRKDVENVTNISKFTLAILFGAATVELNNSNTSLSSALLPTETTIVKGLGSIGGGFTYSYNKINLGLFLGVDRALGMMLINGIIIKSLG